MNRLAMQKNLRFVCSGTVTDHKGNWHRQSFLKKTECFKYNPMGKFQNRVLAKRRGLHVLIKHIMFSNMIDGFQQNLDIDFQLMHF